MSADAITGAATGGSSSVGGGWSSHTSLEEPEIKKKEPSVFMELQNGLQGGAYMAHNIGNLLANC